MIFHKKLLFLAIFSLFGSCYNSINSINLQENNNFDWSKELIWDWCQIDTSQVKFEKDFLWGVATAAYQVEGGCGKKSETGQNLPHINNWFFWERNQKLEPASSACDHYSNSIQDIELIKNLGVKAYRFSVEWSAIEPVEGQFDQEVINHYKEFCAALRFNGIEPMVTLHHFTNPVWFQALGHFEKEENIKYFTRFSLRMFEELKDSVTMWCTINEPSVYIFGGYIRGVFPPGYKANFNLAGKVLKNLLIAHCEVYKTLKNRSQELNIKSKIGFAHNILQFDPYYNSSLEKIICANMTNCLSNSVVNFFKTGKFEFNFFAQLLGNFTRVGAAINYTDLEAPQCLDFFGLNYYCNVLLVDFKNLSEGYRLGEIKTDMPYPIRAEGFYRALMQLKDIKVPIYITENGIADAKDDRRELWTQRYIYALYKAMHEGVNVKGFFYWSLMDNFEWDFGYKMKFGLYEVDMQTKERKLRPGANWFVEVVNNTYKSENIFSEPVTSGSHRLSKYLINFSGINY